MQRSMKLIVAATLLGGLLLGTNQTRADEPTTKPAAAKSKSQMDAKMLALLGLGGSQAVSDEEGLEIRGKSALAGIGMQVSAPSAGSRPNNVGAANKKNVKNRQARRQERKRKKNKKHGR